MLLSWLRRPREKYSLENLKYLYEQLLRNPDVTVSNKDTVVEVLRSIAELMIWGDQHNDNFFYFFCEKNILSYFLRILSQKVDRQVNVQLLQTLSIMIANFSKQTSMYYLLSNNHINDLIVHRFDFSDEEVLAYYISFLKTLSLKLDGSTLQFFFNERLNDFPLYTQAVQFFHHSEAMVRIAVRTLTLNVYRVDEPTLRKFILDKSAVPYFSNLVWFIRDQLIDVDNLLKSGASGARNKVLKEADEQIDSFHYIMEILRLNIGKLSEVLADQFLAHLVLPVLIGSIPGAKALNGGAPLISPHLALFILAQVFIIFTDRPLVNSIITCLLHEHPPLLVSRLIANAPEHPVVGSTALTSILYHPQNRGSGMYAVPTTNPSPTQTSSKSSGNVVQVEDGGGDESAYSPARSAPVGIGPVFQPSELPNWKEKRSQSPVRDAFFACLSHEDSSIAFGASSVLLGILKNVEADSTLLAQVRACPQRQLKRRRLLDKLFSVDQKTASNSAKARDVNALSQRRCSMPLSTQQKAGLREQTVDMNPLLNQPVRMSTPPPGLPPSSNLRLSLEHRSNSVSSLHHSNLVGDLQNRENKEVESTADQVVPLTESKETGQSDLEIPVSTANAVESADPLLASEATDYVVSGRRSVTTDGSVGHVFPSSMSSSVLPSREDSPATKVRKTRLDELSECLKASSDALDLHYADDLVSRLIGILESRSHRSKHLLAITCSLICELVHFEPSAALPAKACLKDEHLGRLEKLLEQVECEVRSTQAFSEFVGAIEEGSQGPFGSLFIDVFESAYLSFPTQHDISQKIEDPKLLLRKPDHGDDGVMSEDMTSSDLSVALAEAVTVPLNLCLAIRGLCQKLRFQKRDVAPVQSPDKMSIRKRDLIDTSRRQVLSCVTKFGTVRERKLLVVDDEFLLLANPAQASADHQNAVVFSAIPLRHVEVSVKPYEPLELNVAARGDVFVHSGCKVYKPSSQRRVTLFSLQMANAGDAKKALAFLLLHRARRRTQFLQRVHLFLHTPD